MEVVIIWVNQLIKDFNLLNFEIFALSILPHYQFHSSKIYNFIPISIIKTYSIPFMSHYGKAQYWQDRYSRNSQPFDWYQRFNSFKQPIRSFIPVKPDTKILIPGCGNSRLAQEMLQQGYPMITSIDSSVTCIKNMTQKYKEKTQKIKFQCMDARKLVFENQSFDAIIDKALLDCVMCSQNAAQHSYRMLCEFHRVLKKRGAYVMISYEPPIKRLNMLERNQFDWKVTVEKIPKMSVSPACSSILEQGDEANYHYLYICVKH